MIQISEQFKEYMCICENKCQIKDDRLHARPILVSCPCLWNASILDHNFMAAIFPPSESSTEKLPNRAKPMQKYILQGKYTSNCLNKKVIKFKGDSSRETINNE